MQTRIVAGHVFVHFQMRQAKELDTCNNEPLKLKWKTDDKISAQSGSRIFSLLQAHEYRFLVDRSAIQFNSDIREKQKQKQKNNNYAVIWQISIETEKLN